MEPTLAEKVSVLQRALNLPEGANLVDAVDNALEKIGLADELRGQPLTRKVDAALQTLGVTPQTSVPIGAPVVYPSQVEAKLVDSGAEAARIHELEEQLAAAQAANTQAQERAARHEAALEKALRDAMPGWFALWTPWTDQKHAALETAIAHAEAAALPEGSMLFAALNEAKEAARRGRGELDASARRRRRREGGGGEGAARRCRTVSAEAGQQVAWARAHPEAAVQVYGAEWMRKNGIPFQIQPTGCCAIL